MITGAKMNTFSLYTNDFHAWTQEQVNLLTTQQWDTLDTVNLIEELETLGRKERQELRNRLALLLGHLLKWQFQQRIQIKLLLQDSPSLKPYLEEVFLTAYELGLALAMRETQLGQQIFPEICPYTCEQTLNSEFLPD
jgi:hypothetical protein